MAKTITLRFGETDYTVQRLNIGQLEDITELISVAAEKPQTARESLKQAVGILAIALSRAEPAVAKVQELEASADEIQAAVTQILQSSGLAKSGDKPAGEAQASSGS